MGLCCKSHVEVQHWLGSLPHCLDHLHPASDTQDMARQGTGGETEGLESCQRSWLCIKSRDRSETLRAALAMEQGWQDLQLPSPPLKSGWRVTPTPKCKERLGLLEPAGGPLSAFPWGLHPRAPTSPHSLTLLLGTKSTFSS